jgi:hypothetical protein
MGDLLVLVEAWGGGLARQRATSSLARIAS